MEYFVLNYESIGAGEEISIFVRGVNLVKAISGQVAETQPEIPVSLVD
jgi:hypothetical protein